MRRGVGINRYAYSANDPINKLDKNGHWFGVDDAIALGAGAAGGLLVRSGIDLWQGKLSSWQAYAGAATGGAIGAEAALYTGPAGFGFGYGVAGMIGGGVGSAATVASEAALHGELPGAVDMGMATAFGAGGGFVLGKAAGYLGEAWSNSLSSRAKGDLGEAMSGVREMARGNWISGQERIELPSGRYTIADWRTRSLWGGEEGIIESKFGYSARLTRNQQEAERVLPNYRVDYWTPESVGTALDVGVTGAWSPYAGSDWSNYEFQWPD